MPGDPNPSLNECNCVIFGLDGLTWNENETKIIPISGYVYCDGGDCAGYNELALLISNLPSWINVQYNGFSDNWSSYTISGTAPSYESIGDADETDNGTYLYTGIVYNIGIPCGEADALGTCTNQTLEIRVIDLNESPIVADFLNSYCAIDIFDGTVVGSLTVSDTDIKTSGLRQIVSMVISGPIANYIDHDFVPGTAPLTVNFVFKNTDDLRGGAEGENGTTLNGSVVFTDQGGLSDTGNLSVFLEASVVTPYLRKIGNLSKRRGSIQIAGDLNWIPIGLDTSRDVFLGYGTTKDGPYCGPICNGHLGDDWSKIINIEEAGYTTDIYVESFDDSQHDFQNIFSLKLAGGRQDLSIYTGLFNIYGVPVSGYCCPPEIRLMYAQEQQNISYAIDAFKTGVGPDINFTGGVSNVEGSYFIGGLDQLASNNLQTNGETTYTLRNKLAIIPNNSSNTLGSQDSSFFLYTFGESGVEQVTHSSETGIIEADGFDDHIAIRYASSAANTFYIYDIENSGFSTGISPFSSDITRIISVNKKFWVVGNDESVLFDPVADTYSSINHHEFTGVSGIPQNISVIVPYSFEVGCIKDKIQPNESYVFAVGTGYDGTNNYFPVILDVDNLQILPHASSQYIANIELSGYYLDYYLNYRPDIVQNLHRIIISVEATGTNTTRLLACDMNFSGEMRIVAQSPTNKAHARVSELINNLVLWGGASGNTETVVVDTFSDNYLSFYETLPITGIISIAKSNYNQFVTLLLNESGDGGYIVNDYDLNIMDRLSFTGDLPMGRYGDIAIATGSAGTPNGIGGRPNFLMLPTTTYETNTISGSLMALSTTTTAKLDIIYSTGINDWNIDESTVSIIDGLNTPGCIDLPGGCCDNTTTPSSVIIGTFVVTDDEFDGGNTLGLPSGVKDNDIFEIETSLDNTSGTIRIKECITFDYEARSSYTGVVTGIDPYFPDSPFFKEFVLTINDVDEPPIGITLTPSVADISASQIFTSNFVVSTIAVEDPDINPLFQNNEVVIANSAYSELFGITSDYTQLFIKQGSVFQSETEYTITLMTRTVGTTAFTASATFTLSVGSQSPTAVLLDPVTVSIDEETAIPSTLHLSDITLVDPDSTDQDEIYLSGPDSAYFSIDYDGITNIGNLYLNPGVDLDFETKSSYTGTVNARLMGTTTPVVTANFILLVNDVEEPSGLLFSPSVVYIDETTGNPITTTLSTLSFITPEFQGLPMVVTDLRYTTGNFQSALDPFWILDSSTVSPDFVFLSGRPLDYETQSIYYIRASGYPDDPNYGATYSQGGTITVIVNDLPEPPQITISPTGLSIEESTPTNLGLIKLADIIVQDESQSTISLSLSGSDAQYFTVVSESNIVDSPASSIKIGTLYLNSGVSLDYETKTTYFTNIIATDITDLTATGTFTLTITDVLECDTYISGTAFPASCAENSDGYITVEFRHTGDNASTCSFNKPLSLEWQNLPSGIFAAGNGNSVYNLPTGTYTAHLLGGTIPITSVSFDVLSSDPMEIISVTIDNPPCSTTGSVTIGFAGGEPPYFIDYAGNIGTVPSGSGLQITLSIQNSTSGNIVIRDANGCSVSGGPYIVNFPQESYYSYESQSPPLIHDSFLESYRFEISHHLGPHDINIYQSVSGEKGDIVSSIDKYDTSVIAGIRKYGTEILDAEGNVVVETSYDIFNNPTIYTYDIGNKIYPGSYVFEFINQDGCVLLTELQTATNIDPLIATVTTANNYRTDLGSYVLSQPILDTLFIPYRLLVEDNDVLSYVSNITEKSDIRFEIGGNNVDRNAIYGSVHCDTYSLLNIKFLGLNSNDWYFTIPFYRGFDISDTTEIDILNEDIYLVISSNKKVKIVTELNNNVHTIKLLKGSLLTTDENISQFKRCREIDLSYLNPDSSYSNIGLAKVGDTINLHNKHIPGNIFMVDFLQNSEITQDLSSASLESVTFNCNGNQRTVQQYRNFVINLNNFDNYENIYFKANKYYQNNGFMQLIITGGYPNLNDQYRITYQYYDTESKSLLNILKNNEIVTNETTLDDIKDGSYLVKIQDEQGNKLKLVNGIEYDSFYSEMIDYIINTLHTTKEAIGFEYGDLLINIYDRFNYSSVQDIPSSIPGTEPDEIDTTSPSPPVVITTTVQEVSPNTSYSNMVTIQTDPGKIRFKVTGPYGYNRIFEDRVQLIQLPPGVYNIEGHQEDLYSKYLYQDKRKIFVNTSTIILVDLHFDLYQDNIIIDNQC